MVPSASTATAFTEVVPMSTPTVTSEHDTPVSVGHDVRVPLLTRPRALVTAPLRGEGFDRLQELSDVIYEPWIEQTPLRIMAAPQLASRAQEVGADVVIVESDTLGEEVFERPLRAVAATRGDPVNVDVAAATSARVPVLHCPGRNADAVAELAVALLFALDRQVLQADQDVRSGEIYRNGTIPYQRFRAWELAGRTAGLVGLGAVGRALRWRLEGLGLSVIAYDPYADDAKASIDELLERSDVVSMHTPVTAETTGMIGAEEFAAMRPGALFLNTARAQLHDTGALVDALAQGHLGGAALDHFVGEHLPVDHPLVSMSNVVLTPHIGGATWDTEARQATMVADDLARLLSGQRPRYLVNPEVLP
jgi:D-3-phosphoglycerate dehydrogenase / 2-oxoglutarate reductase